MSRNRDISVPFLRRRGGQRERECLGVRARAQGVGRPDRLLERDRDRVVGDRRRPRLDDTEALERLGSENVPFTRRPGATVDGSVTVSVASPAEEITVATVEAVYSLA